MTNCWVLKNMRILDPARDVDAVGDLVCENGVFAESRTGRNGMVIDCAGKIVMPSPIDLHAHFREGLQNVAGAAETIASGTCAAIRGGFGTVVTMPNTNPPVDTPEGARWQMNAPRHPFAKLRVLPSACCTKGRAGKECADLEALAAAGAVAFTDDGAMVEDDAVMEEVMSRAAALGIVVMDHALYECSGDAARRRRPTGSPLHPESAAVARDIALCAKTGCRLHIQHVSKAESVELIRGARARGLPVTAEATPHHLFFAEEDIPDSNPNWKMNPPLAARGDVEALRRGVLDGTITCFATDHAPHTAEAKSQDFANAPFGVVGLETALAATWTVFIKNFQISKFPNFQILDWARRWVCGPAEVLGIPPPSFAPGSNSPATVLSPGEWIVSPSDFASSSRNSPFIGATLNTKVWRIIG